MRERMGSGHGAAGAVATRGTVAVYGASGHTGGFVLDELARRGIGAVPVGRRVTAVRGGHAARVAPLEDAAALVAAFDGCSVVINAAGPFLDTAAPVVTAALAAGCHYIDVTAEQESARATLATFDAEARARKLAVIPAAGFYGGLADLLASSLAGDGPIDGIDVAVALDHWWPTPGTRRTGERNRQPRVVVEQGRFEPLPASAATRPWDFGQPHGTEDVHPLPFSETITIAHHLRVRRLHSWLGESALRDIRDPATPAPVASDAHGRSPQRFTMQVVLTDGAGTRAATARGRDIYAVTAPLVVEAATRLLQGARVRAGAQSLGAAFDPHEVLDALSSLDTGIHLERAELRECAGMDLPPK